MENNQELEKELEETVETAEEAVKKEIPDWCPFKVKEEQNEALRQQRIYDSLMGRE